MAMSVFGGSRRSKLILIAAIQLVVILYLGYWYSPLVFGGATSPDIPQWDQTTPPNQEIQRPVENAPPANDAPVNNSPTGVAPAGDDENKSPETEPSNPTTTQDAVSEPDPTPVTCSSFDVLQASRPGPLSTGWRQFPMVRPPAACRTFKLPALEALIERMKTEIADPDLFRLFENSYPNTLDTMVKWRGYANKTDEETGQMTNEVTDEELSYIITGDIDAMWLRDSASQIYSYVSLLEPSKDPNSLASLWRGVINSHARYITISPYCHSFQPPPESGISPSHNGAYSLNHPNPAYDPKLVFDCKWELDSLASFLQISTAYYERTGDLAFFGKYNWVKAVQAAVDAAGAMRRGTYDEEGHVLPSAWTFTGWTNRGSETLTNDGLGNPVKENGMVRSGFRPSDDACIFQLLTPSNMMFAAYLEHASVIMEGLAGQDPVAANLTGAMRELAATIRTGIARDAVVSHRDFGDVFAFEVDGYGGANLMDDANVPSLLALPLWNFTHPKQGSSMLKSIKGADGEHSTIKTKAQLAAEAEEKKRDYAAIYQNTRRFVLSPANPYYSKGPVLSAIGGPHLGPGKGWPMAATVAALTAFEDLTGLEADARDAAVAEQLRMVLDSTNGKGVIHETVNAWSEYDWTRSWFGWANGLFGELIIKIANEEKRRNLGKGEGLLGRMWQDQPKGFKPAVVATGVL
ncbi:hypothetical protein QBC47DRAFT_382317 [Echria macrotheca]|uniref:Uncharacterized protein n=1 Tax=Echria macrotheca TaxID=438768 RepID=A0AAJ0BBI1_9PEZI|nr:hypothetical protein QBC47DRAFT_382317 [Echria macrotheca]